jgi:probable biosynthetic protein (TIGR04098 family)
MIGNSLFIVDAGDTTGAARHVSAPKKECIAEFPKMKKMPESILKAKTIRINGFNIVTNSTLKAEAPYTYYVLNDQDAAPGHAMIFAKFVKIMDWAEHKLLSRDLKPGLPLEVLNNTFILERETFYYGNCFAGEYLEVHINGNIKECPFNFHGDSTQVISAAILEFETEIYKKSDNSLLSMAYTKKLIALPPVLQDLISDIKRIISKHNR